jgi:hypothetical protein
MPIPLPILPNTYRTTIHWHDSASTLNAVNVMHFQAQTTGGSEAGLHAVLLASASSAMFAGMVSTCQAVQFDIIHLDGTASTVSFPVTGGTAWGGHGSGEGVAQVSSLIKLQTGLRGRNHRGRVYIPFPAESLIQYGRLFDTEVTAATTAWATFTTAINTATPVAYELGVAAYDRAHVGAGAHFSPVTNVVCEGFTATQRRRQPGRKVSRH